MFTTLREQLLRPDRRHLTGLGLVGLHLVGALLFLVDPRLPLVLLAGLVAVTLAVERPLWGVGLLLAGRLTSTGANAWLRIGKVNVDLFEPALLLAVGALMVHAVTRRQRLLAPTPWRLPVLVFLGWQVLSLLWSTSRGEAVQDVVATGVLLATTVVITVFARRWEDVRFLLLVWLGTSVFVALAAVTGLAAPSEQVFEMAQGSRQGGFGQHPNWFSMNLVFIVPPALALGMIEPVRWKKWALLGAGAFVFFAQMTSGSRGGTYSVLLGLAAVSLFHPRLRRLVLGLGAVIAVVVGAILAWDFGATTKAVDRIWGASTTLMGKSVRVSNWWICWELFLETWGRGIGGGGYEDQLSRFDWWLSESQYRYPHGIFWGLMAHYGVVGLGLAGWVVLRVGRMADTLRRHLADDPRLLVAWAMLASMIGYAAWSFVEFSYDDKPFWEFLGVYTALWAAVGGARAGEEVA